VQLVFEQIRVGGDRNFGYLLGDRESREAVVIDPSYSPEAVIDRARDQQLETAYIINTHGHADHINGNTRAKELTRARVAAHPLCPVAPDLVLTDGQVLPVGSLRLRILHLPGHSDDHLVVHEMSHDLLVTGDLLFVGKVGGTTSEEAARAEWDSLQRLLAEVPAGATVWPGHDYGVRPSSTIALERRTNPFLLCRDMAGFLELKADWTTFKARHGLK
jgi:glyoxylase-like metal-dependent hydrolase (beta-lactamase superfamily II)